MNYKHNKTPTVSHIWPVLSALLGIAVVLLTFTLYNLYTNPVKVIDSNKWCDDVIVNVEAKTKVCEIDMEYDL